VAPSYLEGETPQTPGGGICLLSSLLYQAALATGLTIQERVPHLQTIRTVPPGLDATVWYGQADLKFQNPFNQSVQLRTQVSPASLTVSLHGRSAQPMLPVRREVTQQTGGAVQVRVFQTLNGKERLISSDLYRITPR
jgi:vancomycin resistance protein YoaR